MINLTNRIHIGIIKAQKDYISWSELGLGHSAEYLIVANIAQVVSAEKYINNIQYIYVEKSIKELAELDDLEEQSNLRKGRCDICIEDDKGYVIIEVKNTLTGKGRKYDSIVHDLERIEIFLNNKNTITESYISFINANYINDKIDDKDNRKEISKKINDRFTSFKEDMKERFKDLKFTFTSKDFIEKTVDDKIWGWQSIVVKIQLRKT